MGYMKLNFSEYCVSITHSWLSKRGIVRSRPIITLVVFLVLVGLRFWRLSRRQSRGWQRQSPTCQEHRSRTCSRACRCSGGSRRTYRHTCRQVGRQDRDSQGHGGQDHDDQEHDDQGHGGQDYDGIMTYLFVPQYIPLHREPS